ncbi:MAG: polysaccharide deacetylase family protein [Christensenella sp.]
MNRNLKLVSMILAILMCVAFIAGCGTGEAAEVSAMPTTITSAPEAEATAEPTPTPTPTPEPTPTPAPEVTTKLKQLQSKDGYMPPKSLDGIDPLKDKVVALTFDDGPHPENTPKLLDILKANDAVATFFVVGTNAAEFPDIIKRAYEEGNEIGTHSWNHKDMKKLSLDDIMQNQYGKANDAIEAATGLRALIDRPPYGSMSEELAEQIGREQVIWSVDPNDWKTENRDPDIVYDHVVNGTSDGGSVSDGAVVLSHDIHASTVAAYDRIIKSLKDEGYKFVTVTQMMQIAEIRGEDVKYRFMNAPTAAAAEKTSDSAE